MKKYIQKLFVGSLMAGTLLVSSCASDYLDTAPTDSTGSADAIGTTDNAIKALNGIAKLMSTQHYYFGQGFAGENNIIMKIIRAKTICITYMHPAGHLFIIKSFIHVLTLFTMLMRGITIIL